MPTDTPVTGPAQHENSAPGVSARYPDTGRRWVEFAQIDNLRDLGGLPVIGGGTTRFGVLYRSSTLQQATAADIELLLGELGLRTVVDLRLPDEVEREGYGPIATAAVTIANLPIRKSPRSSLAARDLVPDKTRVDLVELYGQLLRGSPEHIVETVRLLIDAERRSLLFHCAAGKDRTGVLAAVLLDAVGVTPEAIAHDYALTNERMARVRERLDVLPSYTGLPPVSTGILAVEPEVMLRFLERMRADYGGAAKWLLANGLSAAELDILRETLVVSPM
ncbi:tyrosine-protein phosphatase [Nocardia otitidiscaviarum]|uniref:tyrosine-protein phosphatase n=1 Tax=Nocardia otitidiscaviarum TaxID=1823 RepID=UPI001895F848|nr:tyrosine-protein phosphatase [Nocardia otitidiscaviarum]MBF6182059.1 tyrosine-protein phosphatase [Nocardia otitidiscaviarum]